MAYHTKIMGRPLYGILQNILRRTETAFALINQRKSLRNIEKI